MFFFWQSVDLSCQRERLCLEPLIVLTSFPNTNFVFYRKASTCSNFNSSFITFLTFLTFLQMRYGVAVQV